MVEAVCIRQLRHNCVYAHSDLWVVVFVLLLLLQLCTVLCAHEQQLTIVENDWVPIQY